MRDKIWFNVALFSFEPSIVSVLLLLARVLLSKLLFLNVFSLFLSNMCLLNKEGGGEREVDTSFVPVLLAVGPLWRILHLPDLGSIGFYHLHKVAGANCRAHFFHLLFFTKKKKPHSKIQPLCFLKLERKNKSYKYPQFMMGVLVQAKNGDEQEIEISCSQWEGLACTQSTLFSLLLSLG